MEFGCRCRCGDFQLQHSLVSTTKRGLWFGWLRFGPAEGLSESGGMLDAQLPPSLHKDCASDSSSAMILSKKTVVVEQMEISDTRETA